MSDFQGEKEAGTDPGEDEQLMIRIPNPKVYMARQSLWIGRRGKPRCDYCRLNNLKCDRVLPACNHCSWAAGRECKYTPLPTPAHRGIPRCDRCRLNNLKCDRNLPVCNHCKDDGKTECNYTPKKRRKFPSDSMQLSDEQDVSSIIESSLAELSDGHNFYGQNVASSSHVYGETSSFSVSSGIPPSRSTQTGRFTADMSTAHRPAISSLPSIAPKQASNDNYSSFIYRPYFPIHGGANSTRILPWNDPSFAPLPEYVTRDLMSLNSADFPDSSLFNGSLSAFLEGVMPELRETSCITSDVYAAVHRHISRGDVSNISTKMREWVSYHHLCSGSDLVHLLLVPSDSIFQAEEAKREAYRRTYCGHVDSIPAKGCDTSPESRTPRSMNGPHLFERLPVREQIFDILTYAHASHGDSSKMFSTIRNIGFATITWPMAELYSRLCPTCSSHDRHGHMEIHPMTEDDK